MDCEIDIYARMAKVLSLSVALSIGCAIHGIASAGISFIDFQTVSGTPPTNSNILTVSQLENQPSSEEQKLITSPTSVKDYQTGATVLMLTSATFKGCNGGAALTAGDFNERNYPLIYDAFKDAGSSVWGDNLGRADTTGANSMELVFSGLAANTEYTFYLMGGRTNANPSYCPAFSGVSLTVDGNAVNSTKYGAATNGATLNGGSVGMFAWTFTTDENWSIDKEVTLRSENGVYNAMKIEARSIPEPSTFAMSLLPISLYCLRRRRK